jgi:hypothetical protein
MRLRGFEFLVCSLKFESPFPDVQRPNADLIFRLFKNIQRRGARYIGERRRTSPVRWSEPIERNEAYGCFSTA